MYKIEDQYMIGPAIMVKPIVSALAEGGDRLEVYLPGSEVSVSCCRPTTNFFSIGIIITTV